MEELAVFMKEPPKEPVVISWVRPLTSWFFGLLKNPPVKGQST
jgi:hypothetical protein